MQEKIMLKKLAPVFLVGFQRSGTNMTVGALDKSNKILLFNENNKKAFINFKLKDLQIISTLLDGGKAKGHSIALFKPISDTPKSLVWLEELPDLKILFCYRNYNDVINSHATTFGNDGAIVLRKYLGDMKDNSVSLLRKLYGEKQKFYSLSLLDKYYHDKLDNNSIFALSWLFMNYLFFDLHLNDNNRVLLVCYEKTVHHSKFVFQKICDFLGITYNDRIISDINAQSVQKKIKPTIDKNIEHECKLLYEKLTAETDDKYTLSKGALSKVMRLAADVCSKMRTLAGEQNCRKNKQRIHLKNGECCSNEWDQILLERSNSGDQQVRKFTF